MKEVVLNPNCSELVVSLDIDDINEIRKALKKAEEITGYKLVVQSWRKGITKRLDVNDLTIRKNRQNFGLKNYKKYGLTRYDAESGDVIIGLLPNDSSKDIIPIYYTDGYCDRKVSFDIGDYATHHFKALFKIAKYFKKGYHLHDGGANFAFEEWMDRNVKKSEHIKEEYTF